MSTDPDEVRFILRQPTPEELRAMLHDLAHTGRLYREMATQIGCPHQWTQIAPYSLVCRVCGGYLVRMDVRDVPAE